MTQSAEYGAKPLNRSEQNMTKTFRLEAIGLDNLGATDLIAEVRGEGTETNNPGPFAAAYRIHVAGSPFDAEALVLPFDREPWAGRIGIAWGTDADWGDVSHLWATERDGEDLPAHICDGEHDVAQAVDDWLNDADAWEARRT